MIYFLACSLNKRRTSGAEEYLSRIVNNSWNPLLPVSPRVGVQKTRALAMQVQGVVSTTRSVQLAWSQSHLAEI